MSKSTHERPSVKGGAVMDTKTVSVVPIENMVESALEFCVKRTEHADPEAALAAIRAGDCSACHYLRYGLAKSVGSFLGDADPSVLVVYTFEPEYCVGVSDGAGCDMEDTLGINLIAVAGRASEGLFSTIASLEDAVRQAGTKLVCPWGNGCCYALDVKVTDREQVASKRGYGAVICSVHVRPLKVWDRVGEHAHGLLDSDLALVRSDTPGTV
jgi:hypothetical protein